MIKLKGDTDMDNLTDKLVNINACKDAVEWIKSFNSYEEAWNRCERGDWMLWIASKAGVDLRTLTKAKVECAKLVEHLMEDQRSIHALRTAERFADGVATRAELRQAADAAHDAAYVTAVYFTAATDAAHAAYAAHAASYTAHASYTAYTASYTAYTADADTADADADTAYAAAYAVYSTTATDADSVYKETLNKCADICRKYIYFNVVEAFLESIND